MSALDLRGILRRQPPLEDAKEVQLFEQVQHVPPSDGHQDPGDEFAEGLIPKSPSLPTGPRGRETGTMGTMTTLEWAEEAGPVAWH